MAHTISRSSGDPEQLRPFVRGRDAALEFLPPANIVKAGFRGWALLKTLPLSAIPLLLAGSSYLVLQVILRPPPLQLVKASMLGMAFLLWGIVQLMPASDLAVELGNVVIALYVVDLGLIIWTDLRKRELDSAGRFARVGEASP